MHHAKIRSALGLFLTYCPVILPNCSDGFNEFGGDLGIVGGKADNFGYGIESAKESIESGKAYQKLKELVKFSGGNLTKLEELETKHV